MQPQTLGDLLTARASRRRRAETQRLARLFLHSVVWMPGPFPTRTLAALVVRIDGELHFFASTQLDSVDVRLAALGCVIRAHDMKGRDDDAGGVHFATLRKLRRSCAQSTRGLDRFVDEVLLGLSA